jgi:hypothetical protein
MAEQPPADPQASTAPTPQANSAPQPAPAPPTPPAQANPLLTTPTEGRIVALGEGLGDPSPSDLKK